MTGLRVLITNAELWPLSGTVLYVRDLALELKRQGHSPAVLSLTVGEIARELRDAGIDVVDDPKRLAWTPDIIHGHHRAPTLLALRAWPRVPAIYFCHDHVAPKDRTVLHPTIHRWCGVSQVCIDRLARDGAPHNATRLVLNWVDTERFTPRAPLPVEPRRALVFSNYASERTQLPAIREACARAGLALDVIGSGAGTGTTRPEDLLARYDIVFAKAKAAMEAMAVGAAVILCDYSGAGPMVTSRDFDRLRPLNFGFAALTNPLAAEPLAAEIARYDAADATRVRDRIRGEASLQHSVRSMVELYREVIAEHDPELHAPRPRIREPLVQRLEWAWRSIPDHRRAAIERFPGVTQLRLGARRVLRMQD